MKIPIFLLSLVSILGLSFGQSALAQTIPIYSLTKAPTIDGDDADWDALPAITVALKNISADGLVRLDSVAVKGGTHENRVFLFIEWEDSTHDVVHKPWVWSDAEQKYLRGPQKEDRLAVQFAMKGAYTTNWGSGREFEADTWHWKASRSNPLGLAHDKSFVVSRNKLLRGYKLELPEGGHVFFSRPSDSGDKLYTTKRYRRLDQRVMPKYVLTESPQGSVADISALGVWADGRWRLELSRELITGNDDDAALPLEPGTVLGGIAVFDHSENDDHAISDTLTFEFLFQPYRPN